MTRPRSAGTPASSLGDRGARHLLDLGLGQLLRQELGEDGGLGLLGRRPVLASRVAEGSDAFTALLDLACDHIDDLLVGEVATTSDALVLGGGHRHPQRLRAQLVASAHGITHGGLDPLQERHEWIGLGNIGLAGSSAAPRSVRLKGLRLATRARLPCASWLPCACASRWASRSAHGVVPRPRFPTAGSSC